MTNTLFNFSNTIISVESNSLPLLKEVKNLFLPFYYPHPPPLLPSPNKGEGVRVGERELKCEVEYILEVSGEPRLEKGFCGKVYLAGDSPLTPLYETKDPFEFISFIEWSIIDTVLEKMEGFYQIHGGAVVKNDRGLILPAAPGSGKTTLTVALTMNSFQCLSDDVVLIDAGSLKLNPFSRNIFITEEKKAVFDGYGINLPLRKSEWMEYGGWDFIPPHPPSPQPSPRGRGGEWQGERVATVDFIIFPKYNPAQKTELRRISKGKAIFEILKESFNIHKFRDRGVDIVHRLVENAECFQLTVNDLNEAVEMISDLFPPLR